VKGDDTDKPKGAKQDYGFTFEGYATPNGDWKGKLTDFNGKPVYSTGGDIIEELGTTGIPFLQALANREKIAKDLGTYYYTADDDGSRKGMLTCVMPDGIIHHKLNHHITVTTRLSSSDPNLQNVPRPDFDEALNRAKSLVKRMFQSRFGEEGVMAEVDYSQLEVVVQGLLSLDPQLLKDLNAGVDFHCKRLSAKLHEDYADVVRKCKVEKLPDYVQMRTQIKGFTFQRAYGAGPAGIAASTGMSIEEVKELIDVEERLYPQITTFYDSVQASCADTRWPTLVREPLPDNPGVYVQCGRGEYKTPTQARFVFTEAPMLKFLRRREGRDAGFYRPAIQNWPIQGVGGQLVQYVLGLLVRHFISNNNYNGDAYLVNTVHDCVWFDCRNAEVAARVIADVVPIMESIPALLKELFNLDCPVSFPVEAEVGPNMMELKHAA
jgi:DNA polymerase I-like protein with 3'-5' exonuclease and polymerase domains